MRRKRWLSLGVAIAGGGGLAVGLGLLPAVGQNSPPSSAVILATSAPLIDRGAVAVATVYVVCQPGDFANLSVSLTERSGGGIASGSNGIGFGGGPGPGPGLNCTGQIETLSVPITTANRPFRNGVAFGQAFFQDCGQFTCINATDNENVSLSSSKK